jgi:hypothetical protein
VLLTNAFASQLARLLELGLHSSLTVALLKRYAVGVKKCFLEEALNYFF